jgi:hypothetical protein
MSIEQYEGLKRKEENDMLENLKHIWDDFEEDNDEVQFTIDKNDEVQFTIDKKEGEEKLLLKI